MCIGYNFDAYTAMEFGTAMVAELRSAEAVGAVEMGTVPYLREWFWVRNALCRLSRRVEGARERLSEWLEELSPEGTAPEWARYW